MARKIFTAFICLLLNNIILNAQENSEINSEQALQKLKEGNIRFISDSLINGDRNMDRVHELAEAQHPYAIIVSCSDSRVPPEVIFDEGLGRLFVIRLAGEVIDKDALGSIEYAARFLGTPLIMVLGHSHCGAVHAAVEAKDYGENINSIVAKITPAVEKAKSMEGDLMENAVHENVLLVQSEIENAPELKKLVEAGGLKIVSGIYHLENGEVEIFGN